MSESAVTLYQTPEGAIATSDAFGRQEIKIFRDGAIIMVKLKSRRPGADREHFQLIALDADMARHVASVLKKAADENQG